MRITKAEMYRERPIIRNLRAIFDFFSIRIFYVLTDALIDELRMPTVQVTTTTTIVKGAYVRTTTTTAPHVQPLMSRRSDTTHRRSNTTHESINVKDGQRATKCRAAVFTVLNFVVMVVNRKHLTAY